MFFVLLGYSKLQENVVKEAINSNLKIVIVDKKKRSYNKNFIFIKADCEDFKKIKKNLIKKKIFKGIAYCGSDFGLITALKINTFFKNNNLITEKKLKNILKKSYVKKKIKKTSILLPKSFSEKKIQKLKKFNNQLVVKPINSSGSQGITIVKSHEQLINAIKFAKKFSKHIIIEEYIAGNGLDVNGFLYNGNFVECGVADRFFSEGKYRFPIYGLYPSRTKKEILTKAYEILKKVAKTLGINNGPVKCDLILKENKLYFIEFGPRFHGDVFTSNLINFYHKKNDVLKLICLEKKKNLKKNKNFLKIYDKNKFFVWHSIFLKEKVSLLKFRTIFKTLSKSIKIKKLFIKEKKFIPKYSVAHRDNTTLSGFFWFSANKKNLTIKKNILKKNFSNYFLLK